MKKHIATLFVGCALLAGCGKAGNDFFMDNVPNPDKVFSKSEYKEYKMDDLSLEGFTIEYSGNDIKKDYKAYVEECKEIDIWVTPVFDGETSWCYKNEDGSMQIAVNLHEETNKIDVCVRHFE